MTLKGKNRMKWENFINQSSNDVNLNLYGQKLTDIECPECGKHVYLDTTVVLTSYPPQYKYWCSCGWVGNSYFYWGR